jgi:hypothetical protein
MSGMQVLAGADRREAERLESGLQGDGLPLSRRSSNDLGGGSGTGVRRFRNRLRHVERGKPPVIRNTGPMFRGSSVAIFRPPVTLQWTFSGNAQRCLAGPESFAR